MTIKVTLRQLEELEKLNKINKIERAKEFKKCLGNGKDIFQCERDNDRIDKEELITQLKINIFTKQREVDKLLLELYNLDEVANSEVCELLRGGD